MTNQSRPRGRRPGSSNTRSDILQAARDAFSETGFEQTSTRQIAQRAGVDAALIHHHFGTKEQLFREAIAFPIDPSVIANRVQAGPVDQIGLRLVRTFLGVWDDPETGPAIAAMFRSAMTSELNAKLIREFLMHYLVPQVVTPVLTGIVPLEEIPKRAALTASQLLGLAVVRNILAFEPVSGMDIEELASTVAPTVQRYLTGDDI